MADTPEHGIPTPPKTKWIIAIISLAIVLALAFSARPTWRIIKEWRAVNLADEAMEYLEQDAIELAWEKSQSAYALYPLNPEVARTIAEVYTLADPSQAVAFWEETYNLSGDREDLKKLVAAATLGRQFDIAEKSLQEFQGNYPDAPIGYFLEAKLLFSQQQLDAAIEAARKSVIGSDIPRDAHFLYVQLTQFSTDQSIRDEGISHLRTLSEQEDDLGLMALRNLGKYQQNTPDELREVIIRIRAHPKASRDDLLSALNLELVLPESRLEDNLDAARALFQLENPSELVELGRWLNKQGRYVETLEILDEATAQTRSDLFLIWLDAMAVTNQWDVIKEALDDNNTPLEPYLRQLFQARYLQETGQAARAEFAWSRAVLKVANDANKLWFLNQYANQLGLYTEAKEALDQLTELPASRRKAYEQMTALEQRKGTVLSLRNTLREMHEAYPKDLIVQNDLAYANLLLNEEIEESLETAERLVSDGSPYLANRMTLALALYKSGRIEEAATVLDSLNINWQDARSGFRAVYAAVLRASGRGNEANQLLANIDYSSLLKEEQELAARGDS